MDDCTIDDPELIIKNPNGFDSRRRVALSKKFDVEKILDAIIDMNPEDATPVILKEMVTGDSAGEVIERMTNPHVDVPLLRKMSTLTALPKVAYKYCKDPVLESMIKYQNTIATAQELVVFFEGKESYYVNAIKYAELEEGISNNIKEKIETIDGCTLNDLDLLINNSNSARYSDSIAKFRPQYALACSDLKDYLDEQNSECLNKQLFVLNNPYFEPDIIDHYHNHRHEIIDPFESTLNIELQTGIHLFETTDGRRIVIFLPRCQKIKNDYLKLFFSFEKTVVVDCYETDGGWKMNVMGPSLLGYDYGYESISPGGQLIEYIIRCLKSGIRFYWEEKD